MKSPKNRVYCPACGKPKMLFESKNKADKFLEFNSESLRKRDRKAPVRSYYCAFCCGWHVTSNESVEDGKRLDKRDECIMDCLLTDDNTRHRWVVIIDRILSKIDDAYTNLAMVNLEQAELILDSCVSDFDELRKAKCNEKKFNSYFAKYIKVRSLFEKLHIASSLSNIEIKQLFDNPETIRNKGISIDNLTRVVTCRFLKDCEGKIIAKRKRGKHVNELEEEYRLLIQKIEGRNAIEARNILLERVQLNISCG